MEYLVKINEEKHTTIIMVTHDSFVASYSDVYKRQGIGDSYNDLPMLKVVDTAFTFKTSPQEIQKQVHYCVNDIEMCIRDRI